MNKIAPPYQISNGQILKIPFANKKTTPNYKVVVDVKNNKVYKNVDKIAVGSKNVKIVDKNSSSSSEIIGVDLPKSKGKFLLPIKGKVISQFGPKKGGLYNDGINIAAPLGTPVKSIDNGMVIYSGDELKGYGNLVLLKHDGGWISAYAHLADLSLRKGLMVSQGDIIGKIGKSGDIDTPQLHFELRRGKLAVDPVKYLPKFN